MDKIEGKELYQLGLLENQASRALIDAASGLGYIRERLYEFISRGENPSLDLLKELYDSLVTLDSVTVVAIEADKAVQRNLLRNAPEAASKGLRIVPTDVARMN